MAVIFLTVHGADLIDLRRPDRVIGDDEVQLAVVIVVEPGGGDTEDILRLPDSGALRNVGERAVAVVVVQRIASRVAEEQIFVAVVVVVAGSHTEAESEVLAEQAGTRSDILKRAVAAIAEQAIVETRIRLLHFGKLGAVGEEKVHAAVVVEIEGGHSAAHGLREILPAGEVIVRAVSEVGFGSDIDRKS